MTINVKAFIEVAVIVVIAVVVGLASVFIMKKDDQPIEQMAESVIDTELGLPQGTIDLTPSRFED